MTSFPEEEPSGQVIWGSWADRRETPRESVRNSSESMIMFIIKKEYLTNVGGSERVK